jgi:hypothetical protein
MTTRLGLWARIVAPFAAAIASVTALAMIAAAHDTDVTDPNDARGPLDVRAVRLAHDGRPPQWTIETFGRWSIFEIWDRGFFEVLIDTRRGPPPEYYVLVRSTRTRLRGSLWRNHDPGPDTRLGRVAVWHPSLRRVRITLGLSRLRFPDRRDFYRWSVHTVFTSSRCPRSCHDVAPNGGPALQWLPGRSPTPTSSG